MSPILYAFLTSIGILGVGHRLWSLLRTASSAQEHGLLSLGISWLLGYFFYEGFLSLLAVAQLFHPTIVITLGLVFTSYGCWWLYTQRKALTQVLGKASLPLWELLFLAGMGSFVLFWNLYPAFDVDSLAFYFTAIQQSLEHGGRIFSPFTDIRHSVALGENYLYALGFSWWPHSTIFPQIIHGIGKVILLLCVYGAARSLGAGSLALIAAALIMSEEHVIASGANSSVRINMPLTLALFLTCFSLVMLASQQKREYLKLAVIAVLYALTCKYIAITYLICVAAAFSLWAVYDNNFRQHLKSIWQSPSIYLLLGAAAFAAITYTYNWIITGSPLFPASLGPLTSRHYDQVVSGLAASWHYHLSLGDAIKNLSAFMVWPGILSSKLLLPLSLGAGLTAMLFNTNITENTKRFFTYGICFAALSVVIIILHEMYMVFEMRYYRYGIGVYALACTLLLSFLWHVFLEKHTAFQRWSTFISFGLILVISAYCMRYSFDVMGSSRPSAKNIINFLSGQESEHAIMRGKLKKFETDFAALKNAQIDPKKLGFLLSFSWPQAIYPVEGRNIAFLNSAAFPSASYFNEGLFAQNLLQADIRYVFNQLSLNGDYPLRGGAVDGVLKHCGSPIVVGRTDILELPESCLKQLASQQNMADAKHRMDQALKSLTTLPPYDPFNPPPYGGSSGVVK